MAVNNSTHFTTQTSQTSPLRRLALRGVASYLPGFRPQGPNLCPPTLRPIRFIHYTLNPIPC